MREIRNKCVYLQRYIQANFQKLRRGAALGSVTPFRYSSPSAPLLGAAHLSLDFRPTSLLNRVHFIPRVQCAPPLPFPLPQSLTRRADPFSSARSRLARTLGGGQAKRCRLGGLACG